MEGVIFVEFVVFFSLLHAYDIKINAGGFQGNKILFKLVFNYLINITVREKDHDKLNLSLKLMLYWAPSIRTP